MMPLFAKNVPLFASRVTDILIQLLQAGCVEELKLVRKSLMIMFQTFPKGEKAPIPILYTVLTL
jgi:hypothetical protein